MLRRTIRGRKDEAVHMLTVNKRTLLLIASLVWLSAGLNITRIGLEAYVGGNVTALNLALSAGVGLVFWTFVFGKLVVKHTNRISSYEDGRHFFLKFFDIPAFVIMIIMMTGGMAIRSFELAPETCIAVFYTGLGLALTLAGARFGKIWATAR